MSLAWFEGYGIELEYMIVDAETLDVRPLADVFLTDEVGTVQSEVEHGDIAWSNELVMHVIELKTNGPAPTLGGLAEAFQRNVTEVDQRANAHGARLMPTAMHPWMDPSRDKKLWPHEYGAVYETFDRMFDCSGHGWSNLQSMHINLPYQGDEQLARLHDAIRLVLPLLVALAASSPVADGRITGLLDTRLEHYRHNCRAIPCVTGHVVPEHVDGEASYRRKILEPITRAVLPHDDEGVLEAEWVNARGAIVRFVRDSIEIRVLDSQEHPGADLAIAELVVAAVRGLVDERWGALTTPSEVALEALFVRAITEGERTPVAMPELLASFGLDAPLTMGALWRHIAERSLPERLTSGDPLELILTEGPLARRILRALDGDASRVPQIYGALCDCLREGHSFVP